MESIHLLHTAVQGNNNELHIDGWRGMVLFFFVLNKPIMLDMVPTTCYRYGI